ncbi:MAG: UTP--glucose-1-phosphate uridylyltransferase [Planctomycetota bacterium]|jgi:UDP-N-acetylglucosamine/UDP-N-acetylgalactosamine diphosphorylase
MSEITLKNAGKRLKRHKQQHLLRFWRLLDRGQKEQLIDQINRLDLPQINTWVEKYIKKNDAFTLPANLAPAPYYPIEQDTTKLKQKYKKAVELGEKLIRAGKVAAFVVAGGQGTRLGFDGPKGNFPVTPIRNKTLFQLFAETIAAAQKKYDVTCPWYIMTSPLNYQATKDIFTEKNYYGLDKKNVFILQQGTLPNFDFEGKILLADKAKIASSPDGHGGSLRALHNSGAIEDMKKRGVEFISYWQVDNPLINIFDPLFIGLHALDEAEMSSKALVKSDPFEKVGNFCLAGGRITIIEYSDLPDELARKTNSDGSLLFRLGSIGIHILNKHGFSLPLHKAVKKIIYIDEQGRLVKPAVPNGIKLESFVFDAVPMARKSIILQTQRNREFAPVKNAAGVDNAETSRQMQINRAAEWLESAGVSVPKKPDGTPDCIIEIAPSFALSEECVKNKLEQVPKIKRNDKIYLA